MVVFTSRVRHHPAAPLPTAWRYLEGVCRCGRPLIHSGQDESIFKAYQKSSFQWVVKGVRGPWVLYTPVSTNRRKR